jgi:signal transduction histidine kinase
MQSIKQKLLSTKSQTTILSNMSHEIRTPMNAIIDLQMCYLKELNTNKRMC